MEKMYLLLKKIYQLSGSIGRVLTPILIIILVLHHVGLIASIVIICISLVLGIAVLFLFLSYDKHRTDKLREDVKGGLTNVVCKYRDGDDIGIGEIIKFSNGLVHIKDGDKDILCFLADISAI